MFHHDYPLAVKPASMPWRLVHKKKTWRNSLPIDMLLSAVSVFVVAQLSLEVPEGLMNYPVLTYCLALRPSESLALFNYECRFSLSTAFSCHLLTFISCRSFSTSSNHLNLGFRLLLLPSGSLSNIFLTVLSCFILTICQIMPLFSF